MKKSENYLKVINRLIGQNCWSITAGEGTGSNIALDFGKKIERKTEIRNEYLSDSQRKYIGEFSLYITCSWRLDSNSEVVCGSKEPNNNDGPMIEGLNRLIQKSITDISLSLPALDLILYFEGGFLLKVFCDETDPNDEFDNYSVYFPGKIYTVSNRSKLIVEGR